MRSAASRRHFIDPVTRAALRTCETLERRLLLATDPVQSSYDLNANGAGLAQFSLLQQAILDEGFDVSNFDLFLKINGIPGESTRIGHEGEINLDAFDSGAENTGSSGSGGGGGAGKAVLSEPHFVSHLSKASPLIMKDAATGAHIAEALLTVQRKSGGEKVLEAKFTDVLIGSYELTTANDGKPAEEYTLAFDRVAFKYIPQKGDGTAGAPIEFNFDISLGGDFANYTPVQEPLLNDYAASSDRMFLDVAGVDGDSTGVGHEDWIDIESFQWAIDNTGSFASGGGGGAGKSLIGEMQFAAHVSKASPKLMELCATGTHITDAEFDIVRASLDNDPYLHVELEDILVSSYQVTTALNGRLREEFTIQFKLIDLEYTPHDQAGHAQPIVEFTYNNIGADTLPFAPAPDHLLDDGFAQPLEALYLDIPGIAGDATRRGHEDEIELLSYSWGVDGVSSPFGGGGGAGKAIFDQLHFTAFTSKASPNLLQRSLTGTHITDATFAVVRPGLDEDIYVVELNDVVIDGYKITTALNGTLQEEFSLRFDHAEVTVKQFKGDGSVEGEVVAALDASLGNVADDSPQQLSLLDADFADPLHDMFLDIDGIPGESKDGDHKDEIEIESYSWGVDGANLSGDPHVGEMQFVSRVSKASPKLIQHMLTGQHEPTATFSVRSGGAHPLDFATFVMSDVLVSSYEVLSTDGNGGLLEQYTLSFRKVEFEFTPQSQGGTAPETVLYDIGLDGGSIAHFAPQQEALLGELPISNFDIFLKLAGIEGESTDEDHKNQIDIDSFDWLGDTPPVLGGGGGSSKASISPLHVVSSISKATPKLIDAVATGKHIAQADLYVRGLGDKAIEFVHITLEDVLISSYQLNTQHGGVPKEEYTLTFGKIRFEYVPQKADGTGDAPVVLQYDTKTAGATHQLFVPPQNALLDRPAPVPGGFDAILDMDGIDGESTDEDHEGGIDILAVDWSLYNTGGSASGGGGGAGKAVFSEFHFLTRVSSATPQLLEHVVTGEHVRDAVLNFRRASDRATDVLRIGLGDVLVGTDKITSEHGGTLLEEFTLRYGKEITQSNPAGVDEPTISIDDVRIVEGNSGTQNAVFHVTLSHASFDPVTVSFATASGSALAGLDFDAVSGSLTFTLGEIEKTISVPIRGEFLIEADETFKVNLSAPTGGSIADGEATGTIINDDSSGTFSLSSPTYSVNENGIVATITVLRNGGSTGTATVDFATADGTAKRPHDYDSAIGKLTFAQGETSKTVSIKIDDDSKQEPAETVLLSLKNPSPGATLGLSSAVLTIVDNEPRVIVDTPNKLHTAKKSNMFSGELATFTDPDFAVASAFTALISWGDGTSSAGTIAFDSKKGEWVVSGVHTYAADGTYSVLVTVSDLNGATDSATTSIKVK